MNTVDTSGWLEYLADSPLAGSYAAAIQNTDELLVPSIVLYEVFKKITVAYDENRAFQAIAHRVNFHADSHTRKMLAHKSGYCWPR
jgi:uncharacterized protein with PIN domain